MQIILASASPRRHELLEQIGLSHRVVVSQVQETMHERMSPERMAMDLAQQKAQDVFGLIKDDVLVIGADTIVLLEKKVLGKPSDLADASKMLQMLAGRTHEVLTGVSLIHPLCETSFFVRTTVKMVPYTKPLFDAYLASGEPFDKAGSYGIQGKGALLVESIQGDYFNVVGLPLATLCRVLEKDFGVSVYPNWKRE